jgi:hypothetical protein
MAEEGVMGGSEGEQGARERQNDQEGDHDVGEEREEVDADGEDVAEGGKDAGHETGAVVEQDLGGGREGGKRGCE